MPRRKKKAHELTNSEAHKRVFHKLVLKKLQEFALEADSKSTRKPVKRKP